MPPLSALLPLLFSLQLGPLGGAADAPRASAAEAPGAWANEAALFAAVEARASSWTPGRHLVDGTRRRRFGGLGVPLHANTGAPLLAPTDEEVEDAKDGGLTGHRRHRGHTKLPVSFDAREQWGDACPSLWSIRDQGDCGSCWAVSTASAATDRFCISALNSSSAKSEAISTKDPPLASEDVMSCCTECGNGCGGGYPLRAWKYAVEAGIVTGGSFGSDGEYCQSYKVPPCDHHVPHPRLHPPCGSTEVPTPKCKHTCDASFVDRSVNSGTKPNASALFETSKHYLDGRAIVLPTDTHAIMSEIYERGSVVATFQVFSDFELYTGGVYRHVFGKPLGGHAVRMVGWGDDASSGLPFWLIVNSWDSDWGEEGTFRILRGTNECHIEAGVTAGIGTWSTKEKETEKKAAAAAAA